MSFFVEMFFINPGLYGIGTEMNNRDRSPHLYKFNHPSTSISFVGDNKCRLFITQQLQIMRSIMVLSRQYFKSMGLPSASISLPQPPLGTLLLG